MSFPPLTMDRSLVPSRHFHVPAVVHPPRLGRTLAIHDHILRAYLPWFTTNHFRTQPDVDLVIDELLRSNPSLLEPTLYSPLREREFRAAAHMVIDSLVDALESSEGPSGGARRLLMELEDEWEDDMRFGSRRRGSKAQRLFRSLAEVSNAARSGAVGSILRTFFLGWLNEIAEEKDIVSLAGWYRGVERSYMDARDKEECLRELVALRPDMLDELDGRAADFMPARSSGLPSMNWPRRRRPAGRRWWDDENDGRIRRLIDDQDYHDRVSDRERKMLDLFMRDSVDDRRPRRAGRSRIGRSLDRAPRRSRSPLYGFLADSDEDDRFLRRGPRSSRWQVAEGISESDRAAWLRGRARRGLD